MQIQRTKETQNNFEKEQWISRLVSRLFIKLLNKMMRSDARKQHSEVD
jgi:type II secretory pathway component PulK